LFFGFLGTQEKGGERQRIRRGRKTKADTSGPSTNAAGRYLRGWFQTRGKDTASTMFH